MRVDDKRAAEALGRCEAATPGPWTAWAGNGEVYFGGPVTANTPRSIAGYTGNICRCDPPDEDYDEDGEPEDRYPLDDAEFIACAHADLPDALADRAEAVALLRQVVEEAGDEYGFCEAIRKFLGDADGR